MKKTLGGERLGSGNKMQVRLHDYERSTHNLSKIVRTSMAAGVLTPVYRNYALNGDTWDINISHLIKTLPTKGPLMGSMKFQIDFFVCPLRLYVGLLHNNAVKIGMQMDKVYFPIIKFTERQGEGYYKGNTLSDYLGNRVVAGATAKGNATLYEEKNAIPYLAYYDIFKNYYSNKQEENAFVIASDRENEASEFTSKIYSSQAGTAQAPQAFTFSPTSVNNVVSKIVYCHWADNYQQFNGSTTFHYEGITLEGSNSLSDVFMGLEFDIKPGQTLSYVLQEEKENQPKTIVKFYQGTDQGAAEGAYGLTVNIEINKKVASAGTITMQINDATCVAKTKATAGNEEVTLLQFQLENIDKMRYNILKQTDLGTPYVINDAKLAPYSINYEPIGSRANPNHKPMNGLCVKTYQSDIYNAWLNRDWIDGKGALGDGRSIQSISSVDVSKGALTMDALNLAQKIYNMLNRVAASGGTYEDWQEAIYGEEAVRRAESPAYIGGASCEIIFDEVVSTAEAGENPQGNLSGKGATTNAQGGHISIKITEPSIIMGIASITPRIDYSQGNWWANIELQSMDDLHKPALDGIGFQDLMAYNMLGSIVDNRIAVGKTPAYIHWMTDVNECYGDFAVGQVYDWMVLNRKYEETDDKFSIKDLTTYIDPGKYNGIFADAELSAQNYWVQLGFDIKCRRKMSAKLIPNL